MPNAKFDYETAITRLEEINRILADGNLPLEQCLALYEEGVRLADDCKKALEDAQKRIAEVTVSHE